MQAHGALRSVLLRLSRAASRVPKLIAVMVVVFMSSVADAQTTMNPTRAEFNPSPDHNATLPDGTPIVTSYRLDLFLSGASAPFQSVPLGKPSPDADGVIRVNLSTVFVGWPVVGTTYTAAVAAVGPGGSAPSAMSNTFGFSTGSCSFAIAPASQSFGASGGTASTSVTAAAGCNWTATANSSWISIISGTSGSGNGTTAYRVTANSGTTSRTGTMTIAGKTVTITESGACSLQVSPTSQSVTANGGTAAVTITGGSGCAWSATSNASWITIASGATGSGNGSTSYTVAANTSSSSRTGSLTVAGRTVTITEAGSSLPTAPTNVRIKG